MAQTLYFKARPSREFVAIESSLRIQIFLGNSPKFLTRIKPD